MKPRVELLTKLEELLIQLSAACLDDEQLNDILADLNIFARSIDEIVADLHDTLNRIGKGK